MSRRRSEPPHTDQPSGEPERTQAARAPRPRLQSAENARTTPLRPLELPARRREEVAQTVALHPVELSALVQVSAAAEEGPDPQRATVQMIPLDGSEEVAPDVPQAVFPRGSEPIRRGPRRSREMLRVDEIRPDRDGGDGGGRKRRPTR